MKLEEMDFNSSSGKRSQTSNQPVTETSGRDRILQGLPNSSASTEKSVENMLSTSVKSLRPVSLTRSARKDSTVILLMRGNGLSGTLSLNSYRKWETNAWQKQMSAAMEGELQDCLSELSLSPLPGEAEEKEAVM